jgi:hypothetical protein
VNACKKHGKCKVEFFNEQHGFKVIVSKKHSQITDAEQKSDDVTGGQISEQGDLTGGQIGGLTGGQIGGQTSGQIGDAIDVFSPPITESEEKLLEVVAHTPNRPPNHPLDYPSNHRIGGKIIRSDCSKLYRHT